MPRTVEQLHESDQLAKEWGDRDALEYLRSREAAEERKRNMVFEARVFTERDNIPIHWTVAGDSVETLEENVGALCEWLEANQFSAHTGFGTSAPSAPRQTARSQSRPSPRPARTGNGGNRPRQQRPSDVECDFCGGEVWDNTRKKANGEYKSTAPDYSCKDKEGCAGIAWISDNGDLDWKVAGN